MLKSDNTEEKFDCGCVEFRAGGGYSGLYVCNLALTVDSSPF